MSIERVKTFFAEKGMADRVLVFSARPARLKADHPIRLPGGSPFQRRNAEGFREDYKAYGEKYKI